MWTSDTPITYTYAWSDGATGQTDTLGAGDVGQNVSVTVTASNDATPPTVSATSATVGQVTAPPPPPTGQSMAFWLGWSGGVQESQIPWGAVTQVDLFALKTTNGTRWIRRRTV